MNDHVISPRLQQALDLAISLHGRDARKGSSVPVLAHLLSVCALVQHDGGDEDEAIAALLHDSLEDKPELISRSDLEDRFGERVGAIVDAATDTLPGFSGGEKAPWRERKESYLREARACAPDLLRVTIADKIDNLRAILADYRHLGEPFWSRFNAGKSDQLWYYRSALEAYLAAGCRGALVDELARLVSELETLAARDG